MTGGEVAVECCSSRRLTATLSRLAIESSSRVQGGSRVTDAATRASNGANRRRRDETRREEPRPKNPAPREHHGPAHRASPQLTLARTRLGALSCNVYQRTNYDSARAMRATSLRATQRTLLAPSLPLRFRPSITVAPCTAASHTSCRTAMPPLSGPARRSAQLASHLAPPPPQRRSMSSATSTSPAPGLSQPHTGGGAGGDEPKVRAGSIYA